MARAVQLDLVHNIAADAARRAKRAQPLRRARAVKAEAVIRAAHDVHRTQLAEQERFDVILP